MQAGTQNSHSQTGGHYLKDYRQREPPPYPGHSRPLLQPGLRQSYSGSETSTDYSLSSTENLSTSMRQEPQGEETTAVTLGALEAPPTEGNTDCGGIYTKANRQAPARQTGVEIKSANSSTFYVTGNMPPPTTVISSGSHDTHMVNTSHGNHVVSHDDHSSQFNNNNNNSNKLANKMSSYGEVSQDRMSSASPHLRVTMPQYNKENLPSVSHQLVSAQSVYSVSPSSSPTPSLSPMKCPSPLKGSSPTPVQQPHYISGLGRHQLQNTTNHKPVPHMGCGSIGLATSGQQFTGCSQLKVSPVSSTNVITMTTSPSVPMMTSNTSPTSHSQWTTSDHLRTTSSTSSEAGTDLPSCVSHSESPTLAQLMSALSKHTAATHSAASSSSKRTRQRPSTAPSGRQLPTVPPPPEYPGYRSPNDESRDVHKSADMLDTYTLAQSQPDLTHLAEQALPPSEQEHRKEMPSTAESGINLDCGNYVSDETTRTSYQQAPPQTLSQSLSTASLVSTLMQYQDQLQMTGDDRHLQASSPLTTSSSPVPQLDPGMMALTQMSSCCITAGPDKPPPDYQSPSLRKPPECDHAVIATRATQMVENLSEENRSLQQELEGYYKKVYRLQKVELEIQKVQENYETLVKHTQKQESLERLIRFKYEAEVKKLRDTNKELKDQLDKSLRKLQNNEVYSMVEIDTKKDLLGKDSLITKLISQNRDLTAGREQLELEVMAQKSTMNEQRTHMSALDHALTAARSRVTKYEEELQKRNMEEEKVSELQKALTQLQTAVERREAIEQKLRQKLEEEVRFLRSRRTGINKMTEADEGISSDSESPTSLHCLVGQIQEKEQRILALEAEVAKWKQKYLEETALRQFAVDAASVPKDARIAALEQSSLETEKMVADARNDRMKHLEDVHAANRKAAELESKMKTMHAQLAEKDAMIKVLQRHSSLSRTSSISSLLGSPLHSPRPSFTSTSSPLSSPAPSPLSSHNVSTTPSAASSRQNSQLDTSGHFSSGSSSNGGNSTIEKDRDREGKPPIHSRSSSTGTSTTGNSHNSSTKDSQLRDLQHRMVAQAALFGSFQTGSDQLKKYMWQV